MTNSSLRTLWLLSAITILPTAAEAKDKDQLQLDLNKAIGTFWNAPTHPDYIDEAVEVASDPMKQNLVCVNRALGETSGVMKAVWARNQFKQLGKYMIKYVSRPMKAAGLDVTKAAEIATLALEATSGDELKEKLVKKLGGAAVEKIAGKIGTKGFDTMYEYFLPPNASPIQRKLTSEIGGGCKLDIEITLTPPRKGSRANIRLEATTRSCRPLIASEAGGFPSSYRLVEEADLVPTDARDGTVAYAVDTKHYTLTGECGNFTTPGLTGGGQLAFKPIKFDKGTLSVAPGFALRGKYATVVLFDGDDRKYFKPARSDLAKYPYQNVVAVRAKFDKGDKLEARSTSDTSRDGKEVGVGYWFDIPDGATKLVAVEIDMAIDGKTSTAKWNEKEIAARMR